MVFDRLGFDRLVLADWVDLVKTGFSELVENIFPFCAGSLAIPKRRHVARTGKFGVLGLVLAFQLPSSSSQMETARYTKPSIAWASIVWCWLTGSTWSKRFSASWVKTDSRFVPAPWQYQSGDKSHALQIKTNEATCRIPNRKKLARRSNMAPLNRRLTNCPTTYSM